MNTNILRQTFLDYFARQNHTIVPSSSLVPHNDPTLLFTNAGMNQFKNIFLGQEQRPYLRATSSQRCVRAGGKHNDLENVGFTTRHHTFFEMLGNFSFGDYFKREAINYAWDFLTNTLKIPVSKLSVTVYQDDQEAEDIWLKEIKIPRSSLSRCGAKDNFWAMGDTGPCGPCSEIFYDHGNGDIVEIWNLVFMQFSRNAKGEMTPLPKPSIDTGMGLERIAAVMQGVHDNYDIDIFINLIKEITALSNVKDKKFIASKRVIADHIRACSFLISDGVLPSNEGRGYVLRRIIRRAIRHINKMGIDEPFFYQLITPLAKEMGSAYPELNKQHKLIARVLHQEEEQFAATLHQGLKVLEQEIAKLTGKVIPGPVLFRLYDTYGFPADLTATIVAERGFKVDEDGFEKCMTKQRENSQQAKKFSVDYSKSLQLDGATEFLGYQELQAKATVIKLFKEDEAVTELCANDQGVVILDKTPFYAEAGGQIGDVGNINTADTSFQVTDTQKKGAVYCHYGYVCAGTLSNGAAVTVTVDRKRRDIAANHSATHLLHAALQQVLGNHVEQKGSFVDAERLRFDFSHFEPVTREELLEVENIVNHHVRADIPIITAEMALEEAKKQGVTALFGEKYGARVRVVTMGEVSKELCGGTHIKATGEIGLFKIVSETGIAAGIRRIEAITRDSALKYVQEIEGKLQEVTLLLKTKPDLLVNKLEKLQQQQKELRLLESKLALLESEKLLAQAVTITGVKVLVAEIKCNNAKGLRETLDFLRDKLGSAIILLAARSIDKIQLAGCVTKDYTMQVHAGELVRYVAKQIDGKGGGNAEMAQGGGTNTKLLKAALESANELIAKNLQKNINP